MGRGKRSANNTASQASTAGGPSSAHPAGSRAAGTPVPQLGTSYAAAAAAAATTAAGNSGASTLPGAGGASSTPDVVREPGEFYMHQTRSYLIACADAQHTRVADVTTLDQIQLQAYTHT